MKGKNGAKRLWAAALLGLFLLATSSVHARPHRVSTYYYDLAVKDIWLTRDCAIRVELKNAYPKDLPAAIVELMDSHKMYLKVEVSPPVQVQATKVNSSSLNLSGRLASCLSHHGNSCTTGAVLIGNALPLNPGSYQVTARLVLKQKPLKGPSTPPHNPSALPYQDYNSSNNSLTKTLTCTRRLPDFTVAEVRAKKDPDGSCGTMAVTLKNEGGDFPRCIYRHGPGLSVQTGRGEKRTVDLKDYPGYQRLLLSGGKMDCQFPMVGGKMRPGERRRVTVKVSKSDPHFPYKESDLSNNQISVWVFCPRMELRKSPQVPQRERIKTKALHPEFPRKAIPGKDEK